ncbi:MAG TPA: hypothetical protein VGH07_01630 [Chthoniobacterales bacterium]|jgi:DNA-binding transcriptional ArsR family regulator
MQPLRLHAQAAMDSHRAFKANLYEQFAVIGKALDSPARLELLDLVGQTERSVEDLALEAGLSVEAVSIAEVRRRLATTEFKLCLETTCLNQKN